MTQDSSGTPVPAAFNGNGHSSPARQTADGVTAIAGMLPQMAQAVAGLLSQLPHAVAQAARAPQQLCAQCVTARLGWEHQHGQEVAGASARYQQAASEAAARGVPLQEPPESFLPERLRPGRPDGMPQPQPGITIVGGTLVCAGHVPGAPGKPGARPLLIANGPLSSSMLAGIG